MKCYFTTSFGERPHASLREYNNIGSRKYIVCKQRRVID